MVDIRKRKSEKKRDTAAVLVVTVDDENLITSAINIAETVRESAVCDLCIFASGEDHSRAAHE